MPVIATFYGIVVRMYFFDAKRHSNPHIHVAYGEHSAIFNIENASLLAAFMPRRQSRLIQAWIGLRRGERMADWNLVTNGETLVQVDPLR